MRKPLFDTETLNPVQELFKRSELFRIIVESETRFIRVYRSVWSIEDSVGLILSTVRTRSIYSFVAIIVARGYEASRFCCVFSTDVGINVL